MSALNVSILALILMNSVSYGQELSLVGGVETTTPDAFEAFEAAEETIDPQKEYAQFKSAYEKLYKFSSHSKDIGYQQIVDDSEHRFMTTNRNIEHSSNDDNDSVSTTTIAPHYDIQGIDKYIQGNESNPNNETNESSGEPKQANGFSSDYVLSRLSEPIDSTNSSESFVDESNSEHSKKLEKSTQQNMAVYFVQNDATNIGHKDNDSIDYVNDGGNENEENASQPITLSYSTDTTISSIPSAVNHFQTNVPAVNVPSSSTTTVVSLMRNEPALVYVLIAYNCMRIFFNVVLLLFSVVLFFLFFLFCACRTVRKSRRKNLTHRLGYTNIVPMKSFANIWTIHLFVRHWPHSSTPHQNHYEKQKFYGNQHCGQIRRSISC